MKAKTRRNIEVDDTPTEKPAKTRERTRRAVDVGQAADAIETKMRELAIAAYKNNLLANAAAKAEKKVRGELLGLMKAHKLKTKIFEDVQINPDNAGQTVVLEAVVDAPESETADVLALHGLVSPELFLQIVSATKTAVQELAGNAVFEQVKTVKVGEGRVTVKPLKK